jgi:hypothetical protein
MQKAKKLQTKKFATQVENYRYATHTNLLCRNFIPSQCVLPQQTHSRRSNLMFNAGVALITRNENKPQSLLSTPLLTAPFIRFEGSRFCAVGEESKVGVCSCSSFLPSFLPSLLLPSSLLPFSSIASRFPNHGVFEDSYLSYSTYLASRIQVDTYWHSTVSPYASLRVCSPRH